jgi:Centromere DNA-binding protein complex CBF3 subunit, domain 2
MFQGVEIHAKEKTHSARKQSVRHSEPRGVSEAQIRRAGRWNTDAMTGVYLSYLSREFMRSIAGFPQRGHAYFLPRAQETPDETLCARIWPETDVWLERMEAYHPDRADNEVVRLNLAGSGFLRLLRMLRVILLQDSVLLR